MFSKIYPAKEWLIQRPFYATGILQFNLTRCQERLQNFIQPVHLLPILTLCQATSACSLCFQRYPFEIHLIIFPSDMVMWSSQNCQWPETSPDVC